MKKSMYHRFLKLTKWIFCHTDEATALIGYTGPWLKDPISVSIILSVKQLVLLDNRQPFIACMKLP